MPNTSIGKEVSGRGETRDRARRREKRGGDRLRMSLSGVGEIALAITTTTLTTMVVFLPVALVEGEGQFFLLPLSILVTIRSPTSASPGSTCSPRGHNRSDALMLATERRFRPIMMTALTTICGMVPLALSASMQIGNSYKSFGLTLIGGMVTSWLLTLLVVPVFYTLVEDSRAALARTVRAAFSGRREGEPATSDAPVAG